MSEIDFGRIKMLIDPEMYAQVQSSIHDLEEYSQHLLNESPLMDGMFEDQKDWHIRTGIIQDPSLEVFADRESSGPYSAIDESSHNYPFNGLNSIEPFGFKVSVVWVDGYDGGMFNGTSTNSVQPGESSLKSSVESPVQRVLLTFPNVWADSDRSCGDLSLPVTGTLCRIGMARGNVGVYLGAIPLDRSKMPNMRLGEFLKRHYSQSCHLITDRSLKDSREFLDKDIFKLDTVLETRSDSEGFAKPYETDETKLNSLEKYHAHRSLIASNGIENSVKIESNKHHSVDSKRVFDILTKLSIEDCLDELFETVALNDILSLRVVSDEGVLNVTKNSLNQHVVELNTQLSFSESLSLLKSKFLLKSGVINSNDGFLQFHTLPLLVGQETKLMEPSFTIKTRSKTLLELFVILNPVFDLTLTTNCDISCNDAQVNWSKQIGSADSCILTSAVLLVQVTNIVGRPPKYFTVAGVDSILSGNNNPGRCGPRPTVPVDTCDVILLP